MHISTKHMSHDGKHEEPRRNMLRFCLCFLGKHVQWICLRKKKIFIFATVATAWRYTSSQTHPNFIIELGLISEYITRFCELTRIPIYLQKVPQLYNSNKNNLGCYTPSNHLGGLWHVVPLLIEHRSPRTTPQEKCRHRPWAAQGENPGKVGPASRHLQPEPIAVDEEKTLAEVWIYLHGIEHVLWLV